MISEDALRAARRPLAPCTLAVMLGRAEAMILAVGCGMAVGACGEDASAPPLPSAPAQTRAESCDTVQVPAHEGTNVRVTGVGCVVARVVVMAAAGQGRRPYEAEGFSCRPAEASEGDTNYTCSKGAARVTFLYGSV